MQLDFQIWEFKNKYVHTICLVGKNYDIILYDAELPSVIGKFIEYDVDIQSSYDDNGWKRIT
jgi:hypothetical protein